VSQLKVLIYTDDSEFAQQIVGRWQTERTVPDFVLSNKSRWESDRNLPFDLAIVGALSLEDPVAVLKEIDCQTRPAIYVASRAAMAQAIRMAHSRVLVLNDYEGWVNAVVLLASEALRRVEATNRAKRAEQSVSAAQRHALLGRYMLDMRHSLNNALTSIMGNSELLLLEPGKVSADVLEQIETIHTMSMRLHEIIQRFSSLETEMQFADRQSQREMPSSMHSFVSGD
jgi:signal transduction histidine kinase